MNITISEYFTLFLIIHLYIMNKCNSIWWAPSAFEHGQCWRIRELVQARKLRESQSSIKWEDGAGFSDEPSPYWSRPELSLNTFDTELTNYADTYPPSTVPCFGRKKWWFGVKKRPWKPTSRYQANLRVDKVGVSRSRSLLKLSTVANLRY